MVVLYAGAKRLGMPELGCVSMVGMAWFLVLIFRGVKVWRELAIPGLWGVLGIPDLFSALTISLRVVTAECVVWILNGVGVPVEEHRTTIAAVGGELWRFTVADECSGLRTILTVLFVALMISEGVADRGARAVLVLSSIPLGLGANILRTLSIGLVCHWRGEAAGMRFHQTLLAGAGPLAVSLALLIVLAFLLKRRRTGR